jgi:hypothetical protein
MAALALKSVKDGGACLTSATERACGTTAITGAGQQQLQ